MYEKEMLLRMQGKSVAEAWNKYSGQHPEVHGINEGRDRAAVLAALEKVKDNRFWRQILELEKKYQKNQKKSEKGG